MKIIPRDKTENYALPLPIFKSIKIADAICREGKEFDLLVGLDERYAHQLRELSQDESDTDLQDFTSDRKRFAIGTYEYWYDKCRTIFALVHKSDDKLAAVVWFGPKPLGKKSPKFNHKLEEKIEDKERRPENEWHTISFRCYREHRGKGMMKNFTQFTMDTYKRNFPHVRFWTGSDDRNSGAIRLLLSLGFQVNEEYSDIPEHWLVMTKV